MSVNNPDTPSMDTPMTRASDGFESSLRDQQVRHAAYTIYTQSDSYNTTNTSVCNGGVTSMDERDTPSHLDKGRRLSTVRRMFCVLTVFDAVLMATLWFIYINLTGIGLSDSFTCQVVHYNIKTSLFDFVILAFARTLLLLIAYALCNSRRRSIVAVTTTLSCVFLISKVFLFDYSGELQDDPCVITPNSTASVDLLIAIAAFIMPWAEVWIMDFKVIPYEDKLIQESERRSFNGVTTERSPLLQDEGLPGNSQPIKFYSPPDSTQASDNDSEGESMYSSSFKSGTTDFQSLPNSHRGSSVNLAASLQDQEHLQKAKESLRLFDKILAKQDGWQEESRRDQCHAVVSSSNLDGIKGKVYRLETCLPFPPHQVVTTLWDQVEESPTWNKNVLESKRLAKIDEHTEILYNVSSGGPGNIITGRDFVTVRTYWQRGDMHVCSSMSVEHPLEPPNSKYVRGFNGPTGWVVEPNSEDPSTSKFLWILNTDLNFKLWTPQKIIDTALCSTLLDLAGALLEHVQRKPHVQPDFVTLRQEAASLSSFDDLENERESPDSFRSA